MRKTLRGIDSYFGFSQPQAGTPFWYGVPAGSSEGGGAAAMDPENAFPNWDDLAAAAPAPPPPYPKFDGGAAGFGDWHPDDGGVEMGEARFMPVPPPPPTAAVVPLSEFKNRARGRGRGRHNPDEVHKRHTIRPKRAAASGADAGKGGDSTADDGKHGHHKHKHKHHHDDKDGKDVKKNKHHKVDVDSDDGMDLMVPIIPPQHKPFFIMVASLVQLILYVWELVTNAAPFSLKNPWLWGSVTVAGLIDCGGKQASLILHGEWWRFFTPIYLHVSILHIGMNMLSQVRLGLALERTYGASRVAPIYIVSGVFGNIASTIFLPTQTQAGASGAIFGLNGVLFVDLFQNWKLIEGPWKNFACLVGSTLFSLILGILPGIDNFCHIGGFIMGVVSALVFLPSVVPSTTKCPKMSRIITVLLAGPLMLALLAAGFAIIYLEIPVNCSWCMNIDCIPKWFGEAWCGIPLANSSLTSSSSS